jgi:hypothetical protein
VIALRNFRDALFAQKTRLMELTCQFFSRFAGK